MTKREEILRLFPDSMKGKWEPVLANVDKLQEIRVGVGRPVRILLEGEERFVSCRGTLDPNYQSAWYMTEREIEEILKNICRHSLYAYENEIRQGFLTVPGGHRVGIAGQVVQSAEGEIRNITHVRFLNIRVSHEIIGAAANALPFLYEGSRFLNTLIVSPPGCGKTTLLRDIVRQASDGNPYGAGRTVGVVDERSEIAGSFRGIPQNDVGMRTDVLDGCPKVLGMMLLMRSMSPALIAVDEIGCTQDIKAIYQVLQCGSSVAATMHGDSVEDINRRLWKEPDGGGAEPVIKDKLFDRYLFLEKRGGCCRIKAIYDKQGKEIGDGRAGETCGS